MASVLMVCTANMCRSPMAEGIMRKIFLQHERFNDWSVSSAGTWAVEGQPATSKTRRVLQSRGVDFSGHRARGVTREMLLAADVILTMEGGHKEALLSEFPDIAGKIFLLTELVGKNRDIIDPMGGEMADFEDTAREIEKILNASLDRIFELGRQKVG